MVVSSVTPLMAARRSAYQPGCSAIRFLMAAKRMRSSSLLGLSRT